MLLTRETDYAIRALRTLFDGQKKSLAEICKVEYVPKQFGYKILKKLSRAGYVQIKRGKDGGYTICEDFGERSLYDLTRVMENPTDISPCVVPGYVCEVHSNLGEGDSCAVNKQLSALQDMLDAALKSVKLGELLAE